MKELFDDFKVEHHNSFAYRRKMNGTVETANKDIKKLYRKLLCIMMSKIYTKYLSVLYNLTLNNLKIYFENLDKIIKLYSDNKNLFPT